MNRQILEKSVQAFLKANREKNPGDLALKKSPFQTVNASELAVQIDGWQRSVRKLPTWAFSQGVYYPNRIHLEQCSSEHTALIKQTLIAKESTVVDVTGGCGVDSCYMAQAARQVVHCEIHPDLSQIVAHNAAVLQVDNLVCKPVDGLAYLQDQADHSIDYIYIDPSRRSGQSKVFLLEDCEPNILNYQTLFFTKSQQVITKLSPLLDISTVLSSLPAVKSVLVISVDNDCKELLFLQERGFCGRPSIRAIRLFTDQIQTFDFYYDDEKAVLNRYGEPQTYLYDPDVAITKAGAFKSVGKHYGFAKLHQHTHLYTSDQLVKSFPGRVCRIQKVLPYASLKRDFRVEQGNVATRNFPEKVAQIKKKFKIRDGGSTFLSFATNQHNQLIVIVAERLTAI